MKAFVVDRYGKQERLRAAEVPAPDVGDNDVLIQVHATAVNQLDSKLRNGEFKLILPYRPPFILGHDVAGVVVRVGPRVRQFKVGDEVYARPDDFRIGTFAELIAVKEDSVAIKPKNITMEEAASIPLVGLTAWQALVEKARLQKGQKVFIQAGSGGVGTFAIQLAKHLGATVATTTSAGNVALAKSLGVLQPGGHLISISGPPDPQFAEDTKAPWLVKQVMRALSWGTRRQAQRRKVSYTFLFMQASASQLRQITPLIESGAIRPVIDQVFPFESTNEAMAYVESGRAKGKVVIKVR